MTPPISPANAVGTALFAALQTITPVGAIVLLCAGIGALQALFWASAKATSLPERPFNAGKSFDDYHSRFMQAAGTGVVLSIYAGYALLWLGHWPANANMPWLHKAFHSDSVGLITTVGGAVLGFFGLKRLAAATWFAKRWLALEARGVEWHIADSGDAFRIQWRRGDGEYLFDRTVRGDRMVQQWNSLRERRTKLATSGIAAALAYVVWLAGPGIIQHLSPVLGDGVTGFLSNERTVKAVFLFAVIPLSVGAIGALFDILVYEVGAQFIEGAKVLDPHIHPAGPDDVKSQNAHGEADYLTAEEAVRRMGGGERE